MSEKRSEYILDSDEVHRIINATQSTRDKLILELLAYTGCRREELTLLRFKDILTKLDSDGNSIIDKIKIPTVKQEKRKTKDKNGKPINLPPLSKEERIQIAYKHAREIPIINDDLRRDIKSHIEVMKSTNRSISPTSRLIQSRQKNSITPEMINYIVGDCGRRAGVQNPNPNRVNIHPHQFRHSLVRYGRKKGVDYKILSEMIGHSSVSTTIDLYGTPDMQEKKEELKKLKDFGKEA